MGLAVMPALVLEDFEYKQSITGVCDKGCDAVQLGLGVSFSGCALCSRVTSVDARSSQNVAY